MKAIAVILKKSLVKESELTRNQLKTLKISKVNDMVVIPQNSHLVHIVNLNRTLLTFGEIDTLTLKDYNVNSEINAYKVKNFRGFKKYGEVKFTEDLTQKLQVKKHVR